MTIRLTWWRVLAYFIAATAGQTIGRMAYDGDVAIAVVLGAFFAAGAIVGILFMVPDRK